MIINDIVVTFDLMFLDYENLTPNIFMSYYGHISNHSQISYNDLLQYIKDLIHYRALKHYKDADKIKQLLLSIGIEVRIHYNTMHIVSNKIFGICHKGYFNYDTYKICVDDYSNIVYNNGLAIQCVYVADTIFYEK